MGATKAINYKDEDFSESLKSEKVDLILDPVAGSYWQKNASVISKDGVWVLFGLMGGVMVQGPIFGTILAKRIQIRGTTLMPRSLEYKAKLVS